MKLKIQMKKVLAVVLVFGAWVPMAKAASVGEASLDAAKKILGTSPRVSADGRCRLFFKVDSRSAFLGMPVLGSYTLNVDAQEYAFYFVNTTIAEQGNGDLSFVTSQHVSDDLNDNGRTTRGFRVLGSLSVKSLRNSVAVKIVNGRQMACEFSH